MPKIISYTPSWLARPNPGFHVFHDRKTGSSTQLDTDSFANGHSHEEEYFGPNRTIAHRGSEVFVVVGSQLRWADLTLLKEEFEQLEETPSKGPRTRNGHKEQISEDGPEDGSYRVLKAGSIHRPIRQLSISPNGKLLALATSHTVHLAILPDSSHLGQVPNKPIKLKTSTIGRTIHVVSQSPIVSILWHPCGVSGNCLVTVTRDAAVRLWEFDEGNRYASDTPSLAIDLKKLVLGSSEQDDFAPEWGRNRAFSSDTAGMEVASACFGGTGSSGESPWSAMTLWVAMSAGDVYALCPLSPSKWQAPSTMLPSLSTTVVAKATAFQEEGFTDAEESQQYNDQYTWIQDLDGQEPTLAKVEDSFDGGAQVYRRPEHPSPVPKLQGPFQFFSEGNDEDAKNDDMEFSDIRVIAAKIDHESLDTGDDSDSELDLDEYGLSASLVCLMTRSGRVYVCLNLEEVEGQWLPRKKPGRQLKPQADPYLVLLEGLDTLKLNGTDDFEWPTFSPDVDSRYSFFTTHSQGVFFFSFDPWIRNLEKELQSSDSTGISFRLNIFRNGPGTLRELILNFKQNSLEETDVNIVPACLALEDSDLGYFLLTTHNGHPQAATLDRPYSARVQYSEPVENETEIPDMTALAIGAARSAYEPANVFYNSSGLMKAMDKAVPARHKHLLGQQLRLSPATLDLMTEAHRVLSRETHQLGVAAADLFRRCERLIEELKDQIGRVQECTQRKDNIIDENGGGDRPNLEERVQKLSKKQTMLQERHEALKRKLHGAGGRNLSENEKAWSEELARTETLIQYRREGGKKESHDNDEEDEGEYEDEGRGENKDRLGNEAGVLKQRLEEVYHLKVNLIAEAEMISATADVTLPQNRQRQEDEDTQIMIPRDLKARKMAQVMTLLDRETTMIDAARKRLDRLSLASVA